MTKNNNVADLLSSLKEYHDNSSLPVYIPTIGKNVLFKILTIKEHRDLFDTLREEDSPGVIINTFNNLIVNACEDQFKDQLTVLDRSIILLSLRMHLFGDILPVTGGSKNKNTISIQDHISKCIADPLPTSVTNHIISDSDFEITCQIPSINIDINVNKALFGKIKKDKKKTLGHLFMYELVKYIDVLKFNDKEFAFADVPLNQQIQICELLPISISSSLSTYINNVKSVESEYLKVSDGVNLTLEAILLSDEND